MEAAKTRVLLCYPRFINTIASSSISILQSLLRQIFFSSTYSPLFVVFSSFSPFLSTLPRYAVWGPKTLLTEVEREQYSCVLFLAGDAGDYMADLEELLLASLGGSNATPVVLRAMKLLSHLETVALPTPTTTFVHAHLLWLLHPNASELNPD
jgi:hypothetical protein